MRFHDRSDAGRRLAEKLIDFARRDDVIVLALPRGGVPVAAEIARELAAPLDVFLVRKLGVPGHIELAMGAIATGGVEVLNEEIIRDLHIQPDAVEQTAARERLELDRRERAFRRGRPLPEICGRSVILVDDGVATGSTMEAAIVALRRLEPKEIVVAVPVGARETCGRLGRLADRTVCLTTPPFFRAVGEWYDDFAQTTDEEVVDLLAAANPS
jgi:predicted phosphoribosyltransferase